MRQGDRGGCHGRPARAHRCYNLHRYNRAEFRYAAVERLIHPPLQTGGGRGVGYGNETALLKITPLAGVVVVAVSDHPQACGACRAKPKGGPVRIYRSTRGAWAWVRWLAGSHCGEAQINIAGLSRISLACPHQRLLVSGVCNFSVQRGRLCVLVTASPARESMRRCEEQEK